MTAAWRTTVTIERTAPTEAYARINSTRDAAHYLIEEWPAERSDHYRAALRLCTKALRGETSHEAAYISFIAAAREAKVPLLLYRRWEEPDQFAIDIQHAVAENMLDDVRLVPAL